MPSGGIGGRSGASSCLDCDCVPVFVCELVPDCPDSLVLEAVPVFEPPLMLFDPVPVLLFDPALLFEPVPVFEPAALLFDPVPRSEEHTSELQSHVNLVCRLLL